MNDRYLFRAKGDKRYNDGEWYEGYLIQDSDGDYRIQGNGYRMTILPHTICQCTGLKDKNGKLIFENDIIKCKEIITAVSWNTKYASWVLTRKGWMYHHFFGESQNPEECEVIGNIFDNPELLEVEE